MNTLWFGLLTTSVVYIISPLLILVNNPKMKLFAMKKLPNAILSLTTNM